MRHMEERKNPVLDSEEQAVMDHILEAMHIIVKEWGLKMDSDNLGTELCLHVHGMQGFVVQHMLQRLEPHEWGKWYK